MATQKKEIKLNDTSISLNSPTAMVNFASTLAEFIVQQNLYTTIKNKAFVYHEAWQFCGAAMGVFSVVKDVTRIETADAKEIKYRATVELVNVSTDKVVGAGVAYCSNLEDKKKSFDEYAVASMAQTRAVGKAYRLSFGWLMKMAGYESTPAEEVTSEMKGEATAEQDTSKIDEAKELIAKATTYPEIQKIIEPLTPDEKLALADVAMARADELIKIAPF